MSNADGSIFCWTLKSLRWQWVDHCEELKNWGLPTWSRVYQRWIMLSSYLWVRRQDAPLYYSKHLAHMQTRKNCPCHYLGLSKKQIRYRHLSIANLAVWYHSQNSLICPPSEAGWMPLQREWKEVPYTASCIWLVSSEGHLAIIWLLIWPHPDMHDVCTQLIS